MPGLHVYMTVFFLSMRLTDAKLAQGTLDTDSGYGTQDILLYYDTPGQWDSIYKRGKTCEESMSVLAINSNQVLSLNTSRTQTSTFSGCSLIRYHGDTWYSCAGTRRFRSARERWWYIAVARCGTPKDQVTGLYLEYKIHMTNGDDYIHEEFSVDEFSKLKRRQLFHATYKLFLAALFIWTGHLVIMVIAWARYGQTGVELTRLEVTGQVLYYYESPPGYGIIGIHLLGWAWFLHSNVFTLKHAQKKSAFYIPFFSFYTVWFLAGPGVTLIAMFVMAKWSREKTVNGVEQFVTFLGHCFFLVLTRPDAANSNFPYHVRTSQIATLGDGGGSAYVLGSSFELSERDKTTDNSVKENHKRKSPEQKLPPLEKQHAIRVRSEASSLFPKNTNMGTTSTPSPVNFLTGDINRNTTLGLSGNEYSINNNNSTATTIIPGCNDNSNNNITLNANHLFHQSISIMTRRGDVSSNPLPSIGEVRALSVYPGAGTSDSTASLESQHPLSPRGATGWLPKGRAAQLPPLNTHHHPIPNVTGGGFLNASKQPSAPDFDMFQAKK
ncbi:transmembrane protein 145 [Elysia marginata]|uniref:Transmembrane protein 145 n=1 Tax=Elysia marginata TaxID=1093978 RepID=A0AAV4FK76_9GAST|nr:transmembrane protein 145 [Elysia marginata]